MPQIVLVMTVVGVCVAMVAVLIDNLSHRGMTPSLRYLNGAARFPIAESVVGYSPADSLGWAFVAGLANTLVLTAVVAVLSTLIGVPLALARRSSHGLARNLAGGYIELVRNTPLVVQLLFWYGALTISLPPPRGALQPLSGVFLTDRGLYFTSFGVTGSALPLFGTMLAGLAVVCFLAWRGQLHRASMVTLATAIAGMILWFALDLGIARDVPRIGRYNFTGGVSITPEFAAAVFGSVLYAGAYAAEIFRGGLNAVPAGQWAASRALGMSDRQCLQLVIVPQALKTMVPPMTNQLISILKNSTLALVVGYPELTFVANTTMNHTGRALETVAILMLVFLMLAGVISLLMNRLDAHVALPGAR